MTLELYQSKIFVIRNVEVMLDRDVAEALEVPTGDVNRNAKDSPKWDYLREKGIEEQYRFQLTSDELDWVFSNGQISELRSVTRNTSNLPWVYTKIGCAYLGTSMNNPKACEMAINLAEVYVAYKEGKLLQLADPLHQAIHNKTQELKIAYSFSKSYMDMAALMGNSISVARANAIQSLNREFKLDYKHMLSENISTVQTDLLTATELGILVNLSAQKINQLLSFLGLYIRVGNKWRLTPEGEKYAQRLDVGKKHSDGSMVQQIKWYKDKILPLIQNKINLGE